MRDQNQLYCWTLKSTSELLLEFTAAWLRLKHTNVEFSKWNCTFPNHPYCFLKHSVSISSVIAISDFLVFSSLQSCSRLASAFFCFVHSEKKTYFQVWVSGWDDIQSLLYLSFLYWLYRPISLANEMISFTLDWGVQIII